MLRVCVNVSVSMYPFCIAGYVRVGVCECLVEWMCVCVSACSGVALCGRRLIPAAHTGSLRLRVWVQHSIGLSRRLVTQRAAYRYSGWGAALHSSLGGAPFHGCLHGHTRGHSLHRGASRPVRHRPRPRQSTATPGLRQERQVGRQAGEPRIKVSSSLVVVCSCVCFTVWFSVGVIRTCGYWGGRSCLGQAWGRNRPGSYDCH